MREDGDGPVSIATGRPGMTQWRMLVLGVLRLGLNADYGKCSPCSRRTPNGSAKARPAFRSSSVCV